MTKKNTNQQFYAYCDAIEETGEVIYCGKGTNYRTTLFIRNKKYNNIKNKRKLTRTIFPMLDEDLAIEYENWLIEHYHTWVDDPLCSEYACNIDGPGTNGGSKSRSKAVSVQIGLSHIGLKRTKKQCNNISVAMKGKKKSITHCLNISKSLSNLPRPWKCKAINQYDKNMNLIATYKSISEAYKITNIKNIGGCCHYPNKRPYAGGFIWKYVSEHI
jgi:hypothetical protein